MLPVGTLQALAYIRRNCCRLTYHKGCEHIESACRLKWMNAKRLSKLEWMCFVCGPSIVFNYILCFFKRLDKETWGNTSFDWVSTHSYVNQRCFCCCYHNNRPLCITAGGYMNKCLSAVGVITLILCSLSVLQAYCCYFSEKAIYVICLCWCTMLDWQMV